MFIAPIFREWIAKKKKKKKRLGRNIKDKCSPQINVPLLIFKTNHYDIKGFNRRITQVDTRSMFHWQFLITYIFFVSLKFRACYITGQCGEFTVKNATLYLLILSWYFLLFFFKKLVLLSFSFLLLIKCGISNQKPE